MRKRLRLLATGLAATLILAVASTASARRMSISEDDFRLTWMRLTFQAVQSTHCPVTMSGSFHSRTSTKTNEALSGHITSVSVGDCEGDNSATALTETLPWHLQYNGFTGILPNITGLRTLLIGASWRVQAESVVCLSRTSLAEPAGSTLAVNSTTGQITSSRADESFQIDLDDPSFFCDLAGDATFFGTASVTTPAGGLIFVDLI